jgi:Ca2+-binding EF-hand superfamily protein
MTVKEETTTVTTGVSTSSATTDKPVPSITLSIAQDDVKRVLDASEAIAKTLALLQKADEESAAAPETTSTPEDPVVDTPMETEEADQPQVKSEPEEETAPELKESAPETPADSATEESTPKDAVKKNKRPLHEMIYEAAQQCDHPMIPAFFEKMRASGSSPLEVRAGILVFHDLDMSEKMRLIFNVLGKEQPTPDAPSDPDSEETAERTLSRDGAMSLFRSVIVAISSCIHQDKRVQIEMEKDTITSEPPTKKRKVEVSSPESDKSVKTQDQSSGGDSVPALQSPSRSFDSTIGTLREEDELATHGVRKEFEDIAMYATDRLIRYCSKKGIGSKTNVAINFTTFEAWRKTEGPKIAPWMALLDLAKWKPPQKPTARSSQAPPPKKEAEIKESKSLEAPKVEEQKVKSPEAKPSPKPSPAKDSPKAAPTPQSAVASPMFEDNSSTRTVVSFDFTGSVPDSESESMFCINITEGNLSTLKNLVRNTGLANRPVNEITEILLGASKSKDGQEIVPIERFHTCLHQLLGSGSQKRLSRMDHDLFSSSFVDFFSCYDTRQPPLEAGEVDAMELAIGFCFLGAGNKSAKLAAGFDMLQSEPSAGLTTEQLTTFLRSYLTMLCGISLLTSSTDGIMKPKLNAARRKAMHTSVENGSKWTMAHFLKTTKASKDDIHSFEAFASWYTAGGFNVAPWLELLDLKKLLSLVGEVNGIGPKTPPSEHQDTLPIFPGSTTESPGFSPPQTPDFPTTPSEDPFTRATSSPATEVLFTFPLANERSLVVLRDDATYVRKVVDQLSLLTVTPDELWSSLHSVAQDHPPVPPHRGAKKTKGGSTDKTMPVNKATFVACMQDVIQSNSSSRKRSSSGVSISVSETQDVLVNFFDSFDLLQIDRVALNELMGGLTLLCGGKKSTKLAFAFSVFDQRGQQKGKKSKKAQPTSSLGGQDLFLFLRSFLIVMFSCCRQSLDLSDDAVNRYIADTANMITDDVMRYQWRTRKKDRVDFDEFGQWYNEGGFETAPWLELLDLKKWVLMDNTLDSFDLSSSSPGGMGLTDPDCPPAPPDDSMDPSFFDDDAAGIMPMDSIDEMDLLLMQPSQDKENDVDLNKLASSLSYSPGGRKPRVDSNTKTSNSLKFHLVTEDDNGGYVVSVSQKRIRHLRHLLTESGLSTLDSEEACKHILAKSHRDDKSSKYVMTKEDFDSAMREVISSRNLSIDSQRALSAILSEIFTAFDYGGIGQVNATEVACGFTVFCQGKKSDKLEYAFEVLDRDRRGKLSQSDTAKYLRSFLTVLLNVVSTTSLDSDQDDIMSTTSGLRCERTMSTVARAVEAGSSWAASQAFRSRRGNRDTLCFDEFAEWYTHVGYSNIPWLELLDLHKWVITEP